MYGGQRLMNTRNCWVAASIAAMIALVVHISSAQAFVVGYIELGEPASTSPESYITGAGHTAVALGQLTGADLSGIDVLWVLNPSNGGVNADFTGNSPLIDSFLANGGNLIFHDRYVAGMSAILPGASGITFVRDTSIDNAEIEIAAGSEDLASAMGVTSTSLDGGSSSSHGYALLGTLPVGTVAVLTRTDPTHVVDMYYGHGGGNVYYSTIPLDFYVGGGGSVPGFLVYAAGLMNTLDTIFVVVLPTEAQTPNQQVILDHLSAQMPMAAGSFLNDIIALGNVPEDQFPAALDALSPEPYAGLRDAALRVVRSADMTVTERLQSLHLSRIAGVSMDQLYAASGSVMTDAPPAAVSTGQQGFSVWIKPYLSVADRNRDGSLFGYTHDYVGLSAGADYRFADNALIGLLLGHADGNIDYDTVEADTDMKSTYVGLYGGAEMADFFLHAQASWFMHDYDTTRDLDFIGRRAESDHDANELGVTLGCEYLGFQPYGWNVVPGLAVEYSHYDGESFEESGAGSFNLDVDGINEDSLASRLSVRFNKPFEVEGGAIIPELRTAWVHEYGDVDRDVTAGFAASSGNSFTVEGVEPERDTFVVGVGANFVGDVMAVYVNYDNELADDYWNWGVSAGIKYSF